MPNRIIKDTARTSLTLAQLSGDGERLFWRMTLVADDYGRFHADPRILLATCFPVQVDKITPEEVETWRNELMTAGAISLYEADGREYGFFPKWTKHQRKYETSKPKFPEPPATLRSLPEPPATSLTAQQDTAHSRSYPKTESFSKSKAKPKTETQEGGLGGDVCKGVNGNGRPRTGTGFQSIGVAIGDALNDVDRRARA